MFNGRSPELSEDEIQNSGFWANIKVSEFQEQRGIPLQIPQALVVAALMYAMDSLDTDLYDVEQFYRAQGYESVYQLDDRLTHFNGKNKMVVNFEKAVYARAKAELLPEFATLSARELHEKRDFVADARLLEKEATMAIRNIKGKKRGSVVLL